jgi:hypothetical protein
MKIEFLNKVIPESEPKIITMNYITGYNKYGRKVFTILSGDEIPKGVIIGKGWRLVVHQNNVKIRRSKATG